MPFLSTQTQEKTLQQHTGANLQDPAWAPILDAVPDKNAVLAASAAAAGPPPSVPRRNNQGGTQQESRRSGFRSGEEGVLLVLTLHVTDRTLQSLPSRHRLSTIPTSHGGLPERSPQRIVEW